MDNNDKYEVADCHPSVDAAVVRDVTERLNKADDMSYLVHRMRKFFWLHNVSVYGGCQSHTASFATGDAFKKTL